MIRPKVRAIECKRTTRERHDRGVFNLRLFLSWIESCDRPALTILLCPAQDVDHSTNKRVTRDLCTDLNNTDNIAVSVQFENSMFIPLTQIQALTVVAEV